jgi:hypothetical protein
MLENMEHQLHAVRPDSGMVPGIMVQELHEFSWTNVCLVLSIYVSLEIMKFMMFAYQIHHLENDAK